MLARAERDRQAAAREDRRRQLVRKELAWLRRGPPARTTKPKFRIEAANALIADEPPARDRVELLRFATARLGDKVLDAEDVSLTLRRTARCCGDVTWRLGPGDRVGPGRRQRLGQDDAAAAARRRARADARARSSAAAPCASPHLSQDTGELAGGLRVLESLEAVRERVDARRRPGADRRACCASGSASAAIAPRTFVRDLSGGERRRLQLMRLLMARAERAAARRADQRPRHRHADGARGPARRLARHARRRQPRPLLRRARLRRRLRAHRDGRDRATCPAASSSTSRGAGATPSRPRRPSHPRRSRPPPRRAAPAARRRRRQRGSSARSRSWRARRRSCTPRSSSTRPTTTRSPRSTVGCASWWPSASASRRRGSRTPSCWGNASTKGEGPARGERAGPSGCPSRHTGDERRGLSRAVGSRPTWVDRVRCSRSPPSAARSAWRRRG